MSSNACVICGKGAVAGRTYTHRGMLKIKGGVGRKTVRKSRRRFLPNLQRVRILLNRSVKRVKVCTACLKSGRVLKAPIPRQPSGHRGVRVAT
ncbi:MAG: 50S ribosomal protein L28 [Candidatus Omnitrophica bacterium]|nr:50S ribosomal protein L28 [Candidatus Omnitrophota bacterium]